MGFALKLLRTASPLELGRMKPVGMQFCDGSISGPRPNAYLGKWCLRAELHQHGIKVLIACPGWVRTDISINALDTHGQPNNTQDLTTENGISSDDCPEQIVHAMEKDKDEVIIGKGLNGIAPLIKRLSPTLVAW